MNSSYEAQSHHEDSVLFQKCFTTDFNCPEKVNISDPFMLRSSLSCTTTIRQDLTIEYLKIKKSIKQKGKNKFLHFWEKRLVLAELSINFTIPLSSDNLPCNYNKKLAYGPVTRAVMMTKSVDACKNRRYIVKDALNTDVFGIAQELASEHFSLYHGTKSSVIASLIQTTESRKIQPDTSGCVFELSMLLQKKQP